jgi:hypothetical protein
MRLQAWIAQANLPSCLRFLQTVAARAATNSAAHQPYFRGIP